MCVSACACAFNNSTAVSLWRTVREVEVPLEADSGPESLRRRWRGAPALFFKREREGTAFLETTAHVLKIRERGWVAGDEVRGGAASLLTCGKTEEFIETTGK